MEELQIKPVKTASELRALFNLPAKLYANDPCYVEPLRMDLNSQFNRKKNSFYKHGDIAPYLAYRGRELVGSVIAIHNGLYNDYHKDKTGFFAFFECADDQESANGLLRAGEAWLKGKGHAVVVGPMSFSSETVSPGILIKGFEYPPFLLMAHALPYYARLIEKAGYKKAIDTVAFAMPIQQEMEPRLIRVAETVAKTRHVTVRSLDTKNFWRDAKILFHIYKEAWADNWGFVPPSEDDFLDIVKTLKQIYIPSLVKIAEVNGEPVGWAIALPNINEILIKMNGRLFPTGLFKMLLGYKKIKGLRLWGLGIKPEYRKKGVDVMLYYSTLKEGKRLGYTDGELSWVLETNTAIVNAAHLVKGSEYKRYRIFQKKL